MNITTSFCVLSTMFVRGREAENRSVAAGASHSRQRPVRGVVGVEKIIEMMDLLQ
jgi:hypothetical protein